MLAVVFVGESRRFPGKHFVEVAPGIRLIDLVVNRLVGVGLDVVIYSKIPFDHVVPVIEDEESWILPSLISLLKRLDADGVREIIAIGGDMPLISERGVNMLREALSDRDLAVVPRWENGYLEPLHALYRTEIANFFEKAMGSGVKSLHGAIREAPKVRFISAERFPPNAFFNVNRFEDLLSLTDIMREEG